MLILTILNTICMVIGYVVLIYGSICYLMYLWLGKAINENLKAEGIRVENLDFYKRLGLFLEFPIFYVVELFRILKERKNDRKSN